MVMDIGHTTATATCLNCDRPLVLVRWSTLITEPQWMHDVDPLMAHCPSTLANPDPATIRASD